MIDMQVKNVLQLKLYHAKEIVNDFLEDYGLQIEQCALQVDRTPNNAHFKHPYYILIENMKKVLLSQHILNIESGNS